MHARLRTQFARLKLAALTVGLVLGASGGLTAAADTVEPWVYAHAGLDHFYNLEYEKAEEYFQQALQGEPDNPVFLNFLANTYLFRELFRTGQLDAQLYSESNAFLQAEKPTPDPKVMDKLKELLGRSRELCNRRFKENPSDKTALYALGITYGIEANYEFTIYKRWYAALKAGTRAKHYHTRLKRIDPNYHDADLVLGLYEYAVGSIPGAVKWIALLVGYRGSKQRGIRMLQTAMTEGYLATTDAAVLLVVIYNRERKFAYMRTLLEKLAEYYPRNYLLPLEIARTYLREGNDNAALAAYVQIVEKVERSVPGFYRVAPDRLYYQIGSLQQRLGDFSQALAAFEKITEAPEADGLITAYSRVRRGQIFLAQNRPELVRRECEQVLAMPYAEPKAQAQQLLQALATRQP